MLQLWTCTCSPAPMSRVAKPMIWSNLRTGLPAGIGRVATLCPAGMRCVAASPPSPSGCAPGRMSTRATTTLSLGFSLTVSVAGVIGCSSCCAPDIGARSAGHHPLQREGRRRHGRTVMLGAAHRNGFMVMAEAGARLYQDDYHAWALGQAKALRRLAQD